jgi:hypothetical protein
MARNLTAAINSWLLHCKEQGHITQAEALDLGRKPHPRKYATFTIFHASQRVHCDFPGCHFVVPYDNPSPQ